MSHQLTADRITPDQENNLIDPPYIIVYQSAFGITSPSGFRLIATCFGVFSIIQLG